MLGSYAVVGRVVRFKPRFPLERGVEYRAVFHWPATPGVQGNGIRLSQSFVIPAAAAGPSTRVMAIFPSSAELPENVLRFYVQFSAPMSQGNSYGYVHLRDDKGVEIDRPFLELPQELWSPDGTRLTLALRAWPHQARPCAANGRGHDSDGRPQLHAHDRREMARCRRAACSRNRPANRSARSRPMPPGPIPAPGKSNRRPPDRVTRSWSAFPSRSTGPCWNACCAFARLVREECRQPRTMNSPVPSKSSTEETRWSFTPQRRWSAGRYALVVSTILEDRAGNSIRLPFEVDLNRPQPAKPSSAVVQIEFTVRGRP